MKAGKRPVYRRRYRMLADLAAQVSAHLEFPPAAPERGLGNGTERPAAGNRRRSRRPRCRVINPPAGGQGLLF